MDHLEDGRMFNKMSVLEILVPGHLELIKEVVALSIIGTFYEADQVRVLSEYIIYIAHRSPKELEDYVLPETANSSMSLEDFQYEFGRKFESTF